MQNRVSERHDGDRNYLELPGTPRNSLLFVPGTTAKKSRRQQGAEILAVGVVFREDNVLAGPLYSAPAN